MSAPLRRGYTEVTARYLVRDDGLAEATKFTRADGANFTGWVVRATRDRSYSDVIATKREAIQQLMLWGKPT